MRKARLLPVVARARRASLPRGCCSPFSSSEANQRRRRSSSSSHRMEPPLAQVPKAEAFVAFLDLRFLVAVLRAVAGFKEENGSPPRLPSQPVPVSATPCC